MTNHKFLRSIGFEADMTREDLKELINKAAHEAYSKEYTTIENDDLYAEYKMRISEHAGICIRGVYSEENVFTIDYYFPYAEGDIISSDEDISIERQIMGLAYTGLVDEYKLGISLLFYVRNIIEYLKFEFTDKDLPDSLSVVLTGLSEGGTVLMPILKEPDEEFKNEQYHAKRSRMLKEAANGNKDVIEDLSIQDVFTEDLLNKKIKTEDLYTLVDTYVMPYGLECELYSVLGEIKSYSLEKNCITNKEIYVMNLDVNSVNIEVCVNKNDVIGEVEVGRRFKGSVWLQGQLIF